MIFEKEYVKRLFAMVEDYHNNHNSDNNKKFWQIFLEKVNPIDFIYSGASEYELYLNYMLKYHKEKITIRKLEWTNVSNPPNNYIASKYQYVSWHHYRR
jgi:hypothetical protein